MELKNLLCEYLSNPIGIDVPKPRFSWQIEADEPGIYQAAYQLQVVENCRDFEWSCFWDTGKVNSDCSIHVEYEGPALKSCTRYYFRVRIWDREGTQSPWSEIYFFETAFMKRGEWSASWITPDFPEDKKGTKPVYYFRKNIQCSKKIVKARIYASALGLYEIYLNGTKAGDALFAPGLTSYRNYVQYQTYDVTELLKDNSNNITVLLADGWYRGVFTFKNWRNLWGDKTAFIFQMHVEYEDGKTEVFVSDESWKVTDKGPVLTSEFYAGECYDAELEDGRMKPEYKDDTYRNVRIYTKYSKGKLKAQIGERVVKTGEIKPISMFRTPKGEMVVDLGQNMAGWIRLKLKNTSKGQKIVISHAEILDNENNFYTANLRKAKAQLEYVCRGADLEEYEPHFTYMGFRYVKIEGYNTADTDTVTGIIIHSDLKQTGSFECSNDQINQLQHNILWGQKANFVEIPTDCPQRDERMGYTGDAQIFANTAHFNMRTARFFSKWLYDLKLDQGKNGVVDMTVPREIVVPFFRMKSAGWGDAAVIVPWSLYLYYGDRRILEEQYESMKKWVEFARKGAAKLGRKYRFAKKEVKEIQKYIWDSGIHLGDWLAPGEETKQWIAKKPWVSTAYYAYSTKILAKVAGILSRNEDEKEYTQLFNKICNAFCKKFVEKDGKITDGFQTAYAQALYFGLLPEAIREKAASYLAEDIRRNDNHLTTGFLGTPYLCFALSDFNELKTAYALLFQDTCPSWLYTVKHGATTMWERWDAIKPDGTVNESQINGENMVSFNHYGYGAIGDWLYRRVAGVESDSIQTGFKKIIYYPRIIEELEYAGISFESMYGVVEAKWEKSGSQMLVHLTIPPNSTANVTLPGAQKGKVSANGKPLEEYKYVGSLEKSKEGLRFELQSGRYRFDYEYGGIVNG